MSTGHSDLKSGFSQLEATLQEYFGKKAPALPSAWKEIIVKFSPYVMLIILVISLPALLALLGVGSMLLPFSYVGGLGAGYQYTLSLVSSVITIVLSALAIPGLFKRQIGAWRLLFYSTLLQMVINLVTLNLGGFIIGGAISLYILFQVKELYK